MNDSSVSFQDTASPVLTRWLWFVPQLPSGPDYLRVKLRRRLQKLGAVLVRSSVYMLPATEECVEDFTWLRFELIADGGDAMILAGSILGGLSDADAESLFGQEREGRYAAIADEARAELERLAPRAGAEAADAAGVYRRLRRKLDEVIAIDFFDAPGRSAAEHAMQRVVHVLAGESKMEGKVTRSEAARVTPGSRWVTRPGVRVDRMASAWLIRGFIDPQATFEFMAPESVAESGVIRFDMFAGEYTHEGERCTFETLAGRFGFEEDAALRAIGEVVHDIDCKDGKYGRAETAGVAALIEGIVARCDSDEERLREGFRVFDDLHAFYARTS